MSLPVFVDGAVVAYNAATGVCTPGLVPSLDGVALFAPYGPTTILTPTVSGLYLITVVTTVTSPSDDGVNTSTLAGSNGVQISYTCADTLIPQTITMGLHTNTGGAAKNDSTNTIGTMLMGQIPINALAGDDIQVSEDYTSSGSTGTTATCTATLSSAAWSVTAIELRDITPNGITIVGGTHGQNAGGATTQTVLYGATASADHCVALGFHANGAYTGLTVKDNLGNSLTAGPTIDNQQMFYQFPIPAGVTSYTATWTTTRQSSMCLEEYSGVLSVNAALAGNTASGSSATATLTVTPDDTDDWIVMFIGGAGTTLTPTQGRPRQNATTSAARSILMDQTPITQMTYDVHFKAVFIGGLPAL